MAYPEKRPAPRPTQGANGPDDKGHGTSSAPAAKPQKSGRC